MPVVDVINLDGKKVGQVELADAVFGAKVNPHLLHEASRWYQNSLRAGTHTYDDLATNALRWIARHAGPEAVSAFAAAQVAALEERCRAAMREAGDDPLAVGRHDGRLRGSATSAGAGAAVSAGCRNARSTDPFLRPVG